MTPLCPLCSKPMRLRLVGQTICNLCRRDGRKAPEPFMPEWRRRSLAKDFTQPSGAA